MLVGLPASGKSEYAKNQNEFFGDIVISSDAMRLELYGDETNQDNNKELFELLHRRIKDELLKGNSVVYDATNINYKRRMAFLQELNNVECKKICIIFATPYDECLRRNKARKRVVPEEVIKRMMCEFWVPQYYEGWDKIIIERSEQRSLYDLFNFGNADSPTPLYQVEQDNPHHGYTVGDHCFHCLKQIISIFPEPEVELKLKRAALLHDIGKPFTKTYLNHRGEKTDIAHYYNHNNVGAYMSLNYGSLKHALKTSGYINWHMRLYNIDNSKNPQKAKDKFCSLVGEEFYNSLMLLHKADMCSQKLP
jgi:uncharacterized domain HDIG